MNKENETPLSAEVIAWNNDIFEIMGATVCRRIEKDIERLLSQQTAPMQAEIEMLKKELLHFRTFEDADHSLLTHLQYVEDENIGLKHQLELMTNDRDCAVTAYNEEKGLRHELANALIDIMNYETGDIGPENYAAHIVTMHKLEENNMETQDPCRYCGKTIREQMKGCNIIICYRQNLKEVDKEDFRYAIKKHEGTYKGCYFISTDKAAEDCYNLHLKEIAKWRNVVEELKLKSSRELDNVTGMHGQCLIDLSKALQEIKHQQWHLEHLHQYMQAVESVLGFAGPVEKVEHELKLMKISRSEFLDEIDKARLGLAQVKEMIEDDKFDKDKALEILEKALR